MPCLGELANRGGQANTGAQVCLQCVCTLRHGSVTIQEKKGVMVCSISSLIRKLVNIGRFKFSNLN